MRVLAVDMGATSVRVASVELDGDGALQPRVVARHSHGPVRHHDGSLRWDWEGLVLAIRQGLHDALAEGAVASIGVDGWGVDYGLLDRAGRLVAPPWSYRDHRTDDWEQVADRIGRDRLYAITGIQLLSINTAFQLAAHDREEMARAERLLLLPDLLVQELTGAVGAERSNASTTALLDAGTGEWSREILDALAVDPALLPEVRPATAPAGSFRDVPVHLVGSHDTASAFVATPVVPGPGSVVVSSGTWVLVGAERPAADTSDAARAANFSNEGGALGGVQFLKNVMGLWMLEQCRAGWGSPAIDDLVAEAAAAPPPDQLVDATDARFLAPDDMEREVRAAAGLSAGAPRALVTRTIVESIAHATARVVDELGGFLGHPVTELLVVGGGARMALMNSLLAQHTGLPVHVGSPEATAIGNALVQGIALGVWPDLTAARAELASRQVSARR